MRWGTEGGGEHIHERSSFTTVKTGEKETEKIERESVPFSMVPTSGKLERQESITDLIHKQHACECTVENVTGKRRG